jgi:hypothetical protein
MLNLTVTAFLHPFMPPEKRRKARLWRQMMRR